MIYSVAALGVDESNADAPLLVSENGAYPKQEYVARKCFLANRHPGLWGKGSYYFVDLKLPSRSLSIL